MATQNLPILSTTEIADYLVSGYWAANGASARSFAGSASAASNSPATTTITVDLTGLTAAGQAAARQALALWSDVAAIAFVEGRANADIVFDDGQPGAFSQSTYSRGSIHQSVVNVSTDWLANYGSAPDSYGFQTYIHEIGHALGLGHAGNYNGSSQFASDAHYQNDSWQATIMSYYSQADNPYVDASFAYLLTPMAADIVAVQTLYGKALATRLGDTTYGFNTNAGAVFAFEATGPLTAFTLYDSGGVDTIDASGYSSAQRIDLSPGAHSNVGGLIGNLTIAEGVLVENAIGGSANDTLIGNALANFLAGGLGNDRIVAGRGSDLVDGGGGTDTVVLDGLRAAGNLLLTDGYEIHFVDRAEASRDIVRSIEFLTDGAETIATATVEFFDGLTYIASYGDLIAAFGANASAGFNHYTSHGFGELRTSAFDAAQYVENYSDLQTAFGSNLAAATSHYIVHGQNEGRAFISPLDYVASFDDLILAFRGVDMETLEDVGRDHFTAHGRNEGRQAAIDFDIEQYVENYLDLQVAFDDGQGGYLQDEAAFHFVTHGYGEGRTDDLLLA